MKVVIITIGLYFLTIFPIIGQNWVEIKHDPSGFFVEMPKVPKMDQQSVYTPEGITEKTVYSTRFNDTELYFDIQALVGKQKSETKKFLQRTIDQSVVQFKGTTPVISRKKKGDVAYIYAETPLLTGEISRSHFIISNDYIIHLYAIGTISNVFNENTNRFLETWGVRSVRVEETSEIKIPKKKEKKDILVADDIETNMADWKIYKLNSSLQLELPGIPLKKTTFIENGGNDIEVSSFAFNNMSDGMQYIIVLRPYTRDQGQLTNSSIYNYYLERITKRKRLKLIEEEAIDRPFEGIEYTFSKGVRFYRLKLFRVNNVMYQFLIKAKRKQVKGQEAEHFFNNIKIGM